MFRNMRLVRLIRSVFNLKTLLCIIAVVIIINAILFLSTSKVVVISLEDVPGQLMPAPLDTNSTLKSCGFPETIYNVDLQKPEENVSDQVLNTLPKLGVGPGGIWRPKVCQSRYRVAIVIPYRDRLLNLRSFLAYMHPFLQKQMLDYRIVIVEQTEERPFNRAKLFNIGFSESKNLGDYHCYIFHDVDLLPQNPNNIYACTKLARHMSANIDIFDYKVPYDSIIGGAVAILKTHFEQVNGFSNIFFGWGGEDDDFYNRVTRNGSKTCRFAPDVSQYVMLSHKKEKPSVDRYYVLGTGRDRYITDGLNSLKYTVVKLEMLPLYTRILVDI